MSVEPKAIKHRCQRCGKAYTSVMRIQHHRAAEHAPMTSGDIRTTRDIPHQPKSRPSRPFSMLGIRR